MLVTNFFNIVFFNIYIYKETEIKAFINNCNIRKHVNITFNESHPSSGIEKFPFNLTKGGNIVIM